jgi:parallel beta-helix repeat protein
MSKADPLALILVPLLLSCLFIVFPVNASPRTIVVPDEYSTIVDAITYSNNGDTIFVRAGTYEDPFNQTITVDKTLTIIGESKENTLLTLHPAYNVSWILTAEFFSYSDAIAVTASDCRLLNLTIEIANPGGYISSTGNRTQIIGNNINCGPTSSVKVNGSYCRITDNKMGGMVELNGCFNEIARNSFYSIYTYGALNMIRDNVCEVLALFNSRNTVVTGNRVVSSTRGDDGIHLANSNDNFLYKNYVSGFGYGVMLWHSSNNTLMANTVYDSQIGTVSLGAAFNNSIYLNNFENLNWYNPYFYDYYSDPWARDSDPNLTISRNFWDNGSTGNHWGDYNGSDTDVDGIGDVPYNITVTVDFFEGNDEKVVKDKDNFPLMGPVNIETLVIELPDWALNLPPPIQILELPTVTPTPSSPVINSPILSNPEDTPGVNPPLSPEPASTSTPTPSPELASFPIIPVLIIIVAGSVVAGAGFLLYRKRGRGKTQ